MKILLTTCLLILNTAIAHDFHEHQQHSSDVKSVQVVSQGEAGTVRYLGNEALLVSSKNTKVLFDPFFHNDFGAYQLVPKQIRKDIMAGNSPYNNVSAIFVSHAHGDHFAVDDVVDYLMKFPNVRLFASEQAIEQVKEFLAENDKALYAALLHPITLAYGDTPWHTVIDGLAIGAVRIPHAGWPSRAAVENLVFRVQLEGSLTVMHMGDADPDDAHYLPYKTFWQKKRPDVNFPPYWFLYSAEGNDILTDIIGAKRNIGVHVPMQVPTQLKNSKQEFFSVPGKDVTIRQ